MKKRLYIYISIVIFLFLIFLCFKLFRSSLEFYKREQFLRIYPAQTRSGTYGSTLKIDTNKHLIILLGDSRIKNWKNFKCQGNYQIINMGAGSETTGQILNRIEHDVLPYHPDAVIIQAGINDIKNIGLFPELKENIISNCKNNLTSITDQIKHDRTKVILMEIIPPGTVQLSRKMIWDNDIYKTVREMNEWMHELEDSNVTVINCHNELTLNDKLLKKYRIDDLHLNSSGYIILTECITQYVIQD